MTTTSMTSDYLSKFEVAKVLGLRMEQLSRGATPRVDVPSDKTPLREIAVMELKNKKIPFIIVRVLPDGTREKRRLAELELDASYFG